MGTRSAAIKIRAPSTAPPVNSLQVPSFTSNSPSNFPGISTSPSKSLGVGALTTSAPDFVPSTLAQSSSKTLALQVKLSSAAAEFEPVGLARAEVNHDHFSLKPSEKTVNPSAQEWHPPSKKNSLTVYNQHNSLSNQAPSFASTSSAQYSNDPSFPSHSTYIHEVDRHGSHSETNNFSDSYMAHPGLSVPSYSNFQRPLNYHLYAPPLPHSSNHHPTQLALNSFFMPASIRETLQRKSAATLQGPTHEVARTPEDLGVYHSLVVLDSPRASVSVNPTLQHTGLAPSTLPPPGLSPVPNLTPNLTHTRSAPTSAVFKNPTWIYKAFCSSDGKAYCLYRIEGVQLKHGQGPAAIGQVERWRKIRHPAIVNIREAFTTRAFGDQSILFAFDYHPLSRSLFDEYMTTTKQSTFSLGGMNLGTVDLGKTNSIGGLRYRKTRGPGNPTGNPSRVGLVEERIIWSYLLQIANGIKVVHGNNLAVRTIEPTKILLTGVNRVRINGCGILDVIEYSPIQSIEDLQFQDLHDLGSLVCSIASSSDCSKQNSALIKGIEYVKQFYSRDLNEVVTYLLRPTSPEDLNTITIDGLLAMVWHRTLDEMTNVFNHNDLLEESLSRELENGRLVRLMTKLGFINERPEFDHDPNWSETSERYLLKLFRDYVFHQVDALGKPVTDLSHVLICLNKLDAGLDEKIPLISRDEQTCAVVSYAEIKRILDLAYRDLTR